MSRRPLRIATTKQLSRSARDAGFDVYELPSIPSLDFHRCIAERLSDGAVFRPFFEANDIELVLDLNTEALTLVPAGDNPQQVALTNSAAGIPYVACYLDPVTSTMGHVEWQHHWQLLESQQWIKWVWESAHAEELQKLGVPNVLCMPMAAANDDFDTAPLPTPQDGPLVAFMGHPASSWFVSNQQVSAEFLRCGLTAAAVHADMPDLPFHKIYYDLYEFGAPPSSLDAVDARAAKAQEYFQQKFLYNAWLAIKQRDRFARFLKIKLGDAFELIGDHWQAYCGLKHTPRIWDKRILHERMRQVPICLNLMKGCLETGLNIRHFEITAYGGFMLTYATPELATCFDIGAECDVFHNEEELLRKIDYYLKNERKRKDVAAAGQRRTLRDHLYSHRITTLVDTLRGAGVLPQLGPASPATVAAATSPSAPCRIS